MNDKELELRLRRTQLWTAVALAVVSFAFAALGIFVLLEAFHG